jgi:hypothetical protein
MNLSAYRGLDYSQQFHYKDSAGASIDLSASTIAMSIGLGDFKYDLSITIDNAVGGLFTASASAADTETWPEFAPPSKYDIVIDPPKRLLISGDFIIKKKPLSA